MDKNRSEKAKRALRRFWVAGTAGAFLSGLSRNLPIDIGTRTSCPNWSYTIDLFVRYGYMCWLLVYFFMSSFSTEEDERHLWIDIGYDMLQSILALGAAFYLGFVVRGEPSDRLLGYRAANLAILVIGLFALLFFHGDKTRRINPLRWCTVAISGIDVVLTFVCMQSASTFLMFGGLQLILWGILIWYVRIRWSTGGNYESSPAKMPAKSS